jgi:hypothetical protein
VEVVKLIERLRRATRHPDVLPLSEWASGQLTVPPGVTLRAHHRVTLPANETLPCPKCEARKNLGVTA